MSVAVSGVIADVTVKQTYTNDGSRPINATYVFPASVRAAVSTQPRARATAFVLIAGLLTAFALLFAPPATVTYDVGKVADRAIR